jgi:hypothetical protein
MQVTKSVPPLHEAQLGTHVEPQAADVPVHAAPSMPAPSLPPAASSPASDASAGLVASPAEPSTGWKTSKSMAHPAEKSAAKATKHASRTMGSYDGRRDRSQNIAPANP